MRMDGAGLVENYVFAKMLRMLEDLYKCLKNHLGLIVIHTAEFLKMFYACYECLQMPLQIMRTPSKHLTNEASV